MQVKASLTGTKSYQSLILQTQTIQFIPQILINLQKCETLSVIQHLEGMSVHTMLIIFSYLFYVHVRKKEHMHNLPNFIVNYMYKYS